MTNLLARDVVVERCQVAGGSRTSCTSLGTVAPQADLRTVETPAGLSTADHQALFIHLSGDDSQSYQRDLVVGSGGNNPNFGATCQIERIFATGARTPTLGTGGTSTFAMSTCYGYASGPM